MKRLETTLDKFGRVVIPKSVRSHLGLRVGTVLQVREQGQVLILKTMMGAPPIEVKDGIAVFTGEATGDINAALAFSRDMRAQML